MNTNRTAAQAFTATAAQIAKNLMAETGCSAERAAVLAADWMLNRLATQSPSLLAKVAGSIA